MIWDPLLPLAILIAIGFTAALLTAIALDIYIFLRLCRVPNRTYKRFIGVADWVEYTHYDAYIKPVPTTIYTLVHLSALIYSTGYLI